MRAMLNRRADVAADAELMAQAWSAHLLLGFEADQPSQALPAVRTRLTRRKHHGPLRVQKALYPEGPAICHVAVLHPPSGIAGGDQLDLDVQVGPSAHAVLTTPGATRWYKAAGRAAAQSVRLDVAAGGRLEWLPAENLLFVDADARMSLQLHLQHGARTLGWDVVQLGRSACGEAWASGRIRIDMALFVGGELLLTESADWLAQQLFATSAQSARAGLGSDADLGLRPDPWLDQWPLFGMLWAVGPALSLHDYEELAQQTRWDAVVRSGLTRLPVPGSDVHPADTGSQSEPGFELLLLRCLGRDAQALRAHLIAFWRALRQPVLDTPPQDLRLWAT